MKKSKNVARSVSRTYAPKAQPIAKAVKTELVKKLRTHRKP